MAKVSAIDYVDSSCNEVMGCHGCELYSADPAKNLCYAAAMHRMRSGHHRGFAADFTVPEIFPGRTEKALRWADLTGTSREGAPEMDGLPRIIFWNDMSDTFSPSTPDPDEWFLPLIPQMAEAPHIWLMASKWPDAMVQFFRKHEGAYPGNFVLGTSITSQKTAYRLDQLLNLPTRGEGRLIWLSLEPLLGPVDLDAALGRYRMRTFKDTVAKMRDMGNDLWVAAGGASGVNAPPMHGDWIIRIQDQCLEAGVRFFFKQWGEWVPYAEAWPDVDGYKTVDLDRLRMVRTGKKKAGYKLHGQEYRDMFDWPLRG